MSHGPALLTRLSVALARATACVSLVAAEWTGRSRGLLALRFLGAESRLGLQLCENVDTFAAVAALTTCRACATGGAAFAVEVLFAAGAGALAVLPRVAPPRSSMQLLAP